MATAPAASVPNDDEGPQPGEGEHRPRFRILGPLEASGLAPAAVTARRQRIVLALLLLESNRVVGLETMVQAVWGSAPPTTARAQVQTAVSALRRALDQAGLGKRIRMQGSGYAIDLAPGEFDLHLFDDLVARGRAALAEQSLAAARSAFREALGLWRGEPLAGLDSGVVQARLIRIAERRFEVLEECLDVELRLGLHHEVLGEISALVNEYPLRERPIGQLMLALYRCGRQAEALAVYRHARQTYIEELGLEPSPALHRLELAILNGSADLDPRESAQTSGAAVLPVPRMLPARVPDFNGHRAQLSRICGQLTGAVPEQLDAGPVRVAVITGCAGVGKSAFAVEAAHDLAAAFPDGQLYAKLPRDAAGPEQTAELLERFLRALGFSGSAIPEGLEARAALYRSAIAERRLLIVVEDATDEAQLRALVPGTPTCRLIVTSRARLSGPAGAAVLELGLPSTHDAVEMLAAMAGRERVAAEPSEAIELIELCDGLPLALRAAAARLGARPHWNLSQLTARLRDETRRLDELNYQDLDVRSALDSAYRQLPSAARLLFARLGGLPAPDFPAWVAAPLLDLDQEEASDVLEVLVDARLVDVLGGSGATARYRQRGLVRLFAAECLIGQQDQQSAESTVAARRRLLGAWLSLADEAVLRLGGIPAGKHGDPTRTPLTRTLLDAVLADPAAWYVQERPALLGSVRQAADAAEVERCWNLAIGVGALAESQRRYEDWRESHEHALRATREAEDRLGEAAILYSLGTLDLCEQRYDQAEARLWVALGAFEQLGQERWRQLTSMALDRLALARDDGPRPVGGTAPAARRGDSSRRKAEPRANAPRGGAYQRQFDLAAGTFEASSGAAGRERTAATENRAQVRRAIRIAGTSPSRRRNESLEER